MDWDDVIFVDSVEQIEDPLAPGDFVRVKFGRKEGTYNRKAELLDIDELSDMGCYPDRYSIKMCKSGEELDCVRQGLERW